MTVPEIVAKIKHINMDLSKMSTKELWGREVIPQTKVSQYERATKLKFYLNLESKYPPEVWIKMIK
jgi:hypothetical protein